MFNFSQVLSRRGRIAPASSMRFSSWTVHLRRYSSTRSVSSFLGHKLRDGPLRIFLVISFCVSSSNSEKRWARSSAIFRMAICVPENLMIQAKEEITYLASGRNSRITRHSGPESPMDRGVCLLPAVDKSKRGEAIDIDESRNDCMEEFYRRCNSSVIFIRFVSFSAAFRLCHVKHTME